ncbi:glutamate dehydrogenase [Kineosphaera limosa]|uniref:NAD-specific glutamate dehydrogenase n=1 Tax=Kineosphaera limosa NBRC 100340 TaxID=1184609 RepID=K6VLV5_9MICO|nr:NAD-glutamate dehydrogenase [Kineosphaera limosa]NYE02606.1 glutamate dehydrogenase [Kineosphaera limosa]GAB97198.1 NAD-specific glutamate dehydrogenase [Kineosphaera limosa NBRC 100340]
MSASLEESRQHVLAEAAALADRSVEEPEALLARYYRHLAAEDLVDRRPEDLVGATLSHRSLALERPVGQARVRVFTPTVEELGWSTGHTVVEIVTDDMPFLVDSVTAELDRQNRAVHVLVHPQLVVRRDAGGRLLEVLDIDVDQIPQVAQAADPGETVGAESWMHLQIDRESDLPDREYITQRLQEVLDAVRVSGEDWQSMQARARAIADEIAQHPPKGVDEQEVSEAAALLDWMARGNFIFLGYREYRLGPQDGQEYLTAVPESGLGLMRVDTEAADGDASESGGQQSGRTRLLGAVAEKAREPKVLIVTKANSHSPVHRNAYLDYVGVKSFDESGQVTGERRFLGLFTASAYTSSVSVVPFIGDKVEGVLRASGFARDSHLAKDLLGVLENYPRDELFQASTEELTQTALSVVHLAQRRRTRLFLRRDDYGRFMSCLVYLPRDRYNTTVRLRMEALLREAFGVTDPDAVEFTTRVAESSLARLHYVVRLPQRYDGSDVDVVELERRIAGATRTWTEDLAEAARAEYGEEHAARLLHSYGRGFPEGYKADFHPRVAVADLQHIEELAAEGDFRLNLYQSPGAPEGERRLKLYRRGPVSLSQVLPYFTDLGVIVTDERPYELQRSDGAGVHVYDFGLKARDEASWRRGPEGMRAAFQEAFEAVWRGKAESDGFNGLVLSAGLTWRQIVSLRTIAKYLRQAGTTFSNTYLEGTLLRNASIARLLVELFEVRFDPDRFADVPEAQQEASRQVAEQTGVDAIMHALDTVTSLDEDRIIRSFLQVIQATLRTNFYQADDEGRPRPTVCLKLDPRQIPGLPEPRPMFEIWVYGPRVEGVHLRFGPVARGGLRWSDRREDFRTEILGLVKAQMVKNAVIVPTGSKGGFYAKQLPDPAADREAWLAEGIEAYKLFISALLDVTDNRVGDEVVGPQRTVRHDPDDPYLVVAADKGTASFSDIANGVAQSYGFWLDDAFASGGSAGYDHKGMGITARGAWESVKRHFREMGHDTQTQDFTAVGVGDMSGDVFGNGMLLSEHIRLVAAFDHRHVFIDPDPDAASSYAERRRLFDLPRSSWGDYDTSLISEGGGVFSRTAKSITLTDQIRTALGIDAQVRTMTPAELIKAVLLSPVDLLWNGGIGTYVKAASESDAQIGDRANDAIRINGKDLRVKVVGEGGNLGCSQLGRIEAALAGVRINTDAIDNSAGVDTSDHEVNIKILLTGLVRDDDLTRKQRDELLASMTDEVGLKVLRDNYEQNVLLGNARAQSVEMATLHERFMDWLTERGELDRNLEFLPSDETLDERLADNMGLTSPEFSVLVAYSKLALKADLTNSDVPDEPFFDQTLRDYFPEPIRERYAEQLERHPLRREIVVNSVANSIVNRGGITFVYRAMDEVGATAEQVSRAFVVAREVYDLASFVAGVEALDNEVSAAAQTRVYLEFRRLLDRAVRWFLQNRPARLDVRAEIDRFGPSVAQIRGSIDTLLQGSERARLDKDTESLISKGFPPELARGVAGLLDIYSCLDIVELATDLSLPVEEVAGVYFAVSASFEIDNLLSRVTDLPRADRWDSLARSAMRDDLYVALEALARAVLESTSSEDDPQVRIEQWTADNAEALERTRKALAGLEELSEPTLASLSVGLRMLRSAVRSGNATT